MEKNKMIRSCKVLVIGGSAGSIEVILRFLPKLKTNSSFVTVIVLHRKSSADSALSELFSSRTAVPVKEIEDKESFENGAIYIAPADYHVLFERNRSFSLDFSEKVNYSRPSIDVTFESAADIYEQDLTCLLLSGASSDGVEGLRIAGKKGGQLAVQDPETAESSYMPLQAIENVPVEFILEPSQIAEFINALG